MPTWNRFVDLKKSLNCVLSNDVAGCEFIFDVIVSDDGSTDETGEYLKSVENPKVKYVYNKNSGLPSVARNKGVDVAKGGWLAFCDSDDYWYPGKLSHQFNKLKKNSRIKAICSNAFLDFTDKKYFNKKSGLLRLQDLLKENGVICSSALVDTELFKQCGFFDESIELKAIEDYLMWLKISLYTDFYFCEEPLLSYTTSSSNSVRLYQSGSEEVRYRVVLKKLLVFAIEKAKINKVPIIIYYYLKSVKRSLKSRVREIIKHC